MRTLLRTLAGVVVVAAVGFLWADYGLKKTAASRPALDRQASVADFKLDFPSEWRLEPARPDPRLSLTDQLALASTEVKDAQLVIGTAHPTYPGSLPPRLQATIVKSARPQIVKLGGSDFYRWLAITPPGDATSESIYLLPTTTGTLTAICSAQTRSAAFTSNCERVLATVRLTSGRALSLGVDAGYAFALNQILNQLNAVRRNAGSGLRAASVKARAQAASTLAVAHARAASSARHLSVAGMSVANPALVAALEMNAAAYRALARAADQQGAAGYARAETAITRAGRALGAVFARLRQLGYQIG